MSIYKKLNITLTSEDLGIDHDTANWSVELEVEFYPGREAPRCFNPDDPGYSDPGEPAEINQWQIIRANGINVKVLTMHLNWREDFDDKLIEMIQEGFDNG